MATFVLATVLFLVLFAAMAVGVIFSNKPIKGSCGGLNTLGLADEECPICGGDTQKCEDSKKDTESGTQDTQLAYDATRKS